MTVNRTVLIAAALLCFGFTGPDTKKAPQKTNSKGAAQHKKGSDWVPVKGFSPLQLAKRVEDMQKSFHNVFARGVMQVRMPVAKSFGEGEVQTVGYFWTPKKFQFQYLRYTAIPSGEFVGDDGQGHRRKWGPDAAKGPSVASMFNISSDAQFVESWATLYPRYIFTGFVGGNTTLTRYLKALFSGVGGYKATLKQRSFIYTGTGARPRQVLQYQIFAERPKKGKLPASTVEMIFDGGLWLPVSMRSTYGGSPSDPTWIVKFSVAWANNWKEMPKSVWATG
jgi:hypothetical protein